MLKRNVLLLLAFSLVFLSTSIFADEIHTGNYTMIRESEWEMLNNFVEDPEFNTPEEFLEACDNYIEEISVFLGREDWLQNIYRERIEFFTTRHLPSYISGSHMIAINSQNFGQNNAPIAREIASLIIRRYNSYTLHIGIASAMQERFGRNIAPYNWGENPDELAGKYLEQDYLIQEIGEKGYPYHLKIYPGGVDREPLYVLSHSFVNFLLDEYGVEKLMEVYDATDPQKGFKEILGKELDDLRETWLENL